MLFGLRVYFVDKNNQINKIFGLFSASVAIWLIFDFLAYQTNLADIQLLINRLIIALVLNFIFLLTWFVDIFPRPLIKIPKIIKYIVCFSLILVSIVAILTNRIVKSVSIEDWGSNITTGKLFYIFAILATIMAVYAIFILIYKFIKFKDLEKKQVKYVLYGISLLLILNAIFNMIVPVLTNNFEFGRFGTYSTIFFIVFIAYAILKTRLFNLKVIVTETAVVIINVILAVQIFTSQTISEGLLRTLFLVLVIYGSYLLLGSVKREIKFREELQVMTEQLAHANGHLKELDKMKTEFVSLASHELLTPVSAIEGYLSMMLDEKLARIDDPKAIHYMDRVYASAKRLARLVTDMLNVSRIEEGRLLVEKKEVSLTGVITQTIDELKFKAEEKKQKIIFANANHWETFGDTDKIKEIIINLVGNSIKYSKEPGEIQILVETVPTEQVNETWNKVEGAIKDGPLDDQEAIKSAVDEKLKRLVGPRQILVHVKDQGIGIPREELPRLFKKFHRVGDYTTAESQGTGLGLYITRALVELHHGRVWADSEGQGRGSVFTFSLPEATVQKEIQELEAQVPNKGDMKPLARPTKQAEEL